MIGLEQYSASPVYRDFAVGVRVTVADGEAVDRGVGDKKIILIVPSSGTGDSTFLPVSKTMIMTMMKKIPIIIPVAATVFVRSSIHKV